MEIIEEFLSIQGEGLLVGTPAYFIRLAQCNLRCPWCDTKYSWRRSNLQRPENVALRAYKSGVPLVVLTGGEPLLWLPQIRSFLNSMRDLGYKGIVQIETNGTIYPKELEDYDVWITVSPKVTCDYYVNDPNTVKRILNHFRGELKLVVRASDIGCMKRFLERLGDINKPIVIQPLHQNNYPFEAREVVEAVLRDDWLRKRVRVIPQIHKLLRIP